MQATKTAKKKPTLLSDAEKVFSKGLITALQQRGHDFLEFGGDDIHALDSEGNRYIDCLNGSASFNLGRKNQVLIEALQESSRKTDQGIFTCVSQEKVNLAEAVLKFISGPYTGIMPQVSRGEIVEAACKLARGHTGRSELIAVAGSSHGQTGFATSLSDYAEKSTLGSLIPDTKILDPDDLINAVSQRTAAVIIEPVQSENHCHTFTADYLKRLRASCIQHGAVLIFDESQTGFGRTGSKFAYDSLGISPDILIIGEAINGGVFPMTAMVFTAELKEFFEKYPLRHISTFGGHDVGCLTTCEALKEYERTRPWENARVTGLKLREALANLAKANQDKISEVCGRGLLLGLSLKSNNAARQFCIAARKSGLLVTPGLTDTTSVILRPSLTITLEDVDRIVASCAKALASLQ